MTHPNKLSFLNLPGELRNKVYCEYFWLPRYAYVWQSTPLHHSIFADYRNLLLINKQIHQESRYIFWSMALDDIYLISPLQFRLLLDVAPKECWHRLTGQLHFSIEKLGLPPNNPLDIFVGDLGEQELKKLKENEILEFDLESSDENCEVYTRQLEICKDGEYLATATWKKRLPNYDLAVKEEILEVKGYLGRLRCLERLATRRPGWCDIDG
jgi:hypothetical protein